MVFGSCRFSCALGFCARGPLLGKHALGVDKGNFLLPSSSLRKTFTDFLNR